MRLDSLVIEHSGPGAELTVVDADSMQVACLGADSWPEEGITLGGFGLPFFAEAMETGRRCGGGL